MSEFRTDVVQVNHRECSYVSLQQLLNRYLIAAKIIDGSRPSEFVSKEQAYELAENAKNLILELVMANNGNPDIGKMLPTENLDKAKEFIESHKCKEAI